MGGNYGVTILDGFMSPTMSWPHAIDKMGFHFIGRISADNILDQRPATGNMTTTRSQVQKKNSLFVVAHYGLLHNEYSDSPDCASSDRKKL